MHRKRTAGEKVRFRPTAGGGLDRALKRGTMALVRYQTTCGPVVLAVGDNHFELDKLRRSNQATAYLHHDPGDPPRYLIVANDGTK